MNTYLLQVFSLRLLNDEIMKIIKANDNVIRMNFDECDLNDVLNECSYLSLLNEEKTVIVNNFKLNNETKPIEKYLNNPNPKTRLILITNNIDKRNSTYKLIKEIGQVIIISELSDSELSSKIKNYCQNNNLKIDYSAVNKLMQNNLNNYDLILSEIDKIALETKDIKLDDVNLYGSVLESEENFALCDAITSKDYNKANKLLIDFINNKEEVIPFIALLGSQYRIIYVTKVMSGSTDMIADKLKIHPYRVKLAKEKALNYTKEDLIRILDTLSDMDYKLKTTSFDPYTLLKIFIINL